MQLSITGRNVDVSEALRARAEAALAALYEQHNLKPLETSVVMSRQARKAQLFLCDITTHVARNLTVRAHGEGVDGYTSLDDALETLTSRLRRHKQRLNHHYKHHDFHVFPEVFPEFVLKESEEEEEGGAEAAPAIIAELQTEIPELSVGDAVMRMDLSDEPACVFRNSTHGQINVIYRRADGNIGWIDPTLKK